MVNTLELAREFVLRFRVEKDVDIDRTKTTREVRTLCYHLLHEEFQEFYLDSELENYEGMLKELCDIQYVLDYTFVRLGLARFKDKAMLEVHRSNMSKLDENGNPIMREDGKVLKSNLYSHADMSKILKD